MHLLYKLKRDRWRFFYRLRVFRNSDLERRRFVWRTKINRIFKTKSTSYPLLRTCSRMSWHMGLYYLCWPWLLWNRQFNLLWVRIRIRHNKLKIFYFKLAFADFQMQNAILVASSKDNCYWSAVLPNLLFNFFLFSV